MGGEEWASVIKEAKAVRGLYSQGVSKGKVCPRTGYEGPEGQ
jgi:hypothetical protein